VVSSKRLGHLRETDHLEYLGVNRKTIKMDLQDARWGGMDWIDVAQDTESWRAPVNVVMNLRVP